MSEPSTYTVTKLAGPKVAGRAVQPGDTVTLTEFQARAELLSGAVVAEANLADNPFGTAAASLKAPSNDAGKAPKASAPAGSTVVDPSKS